MLSERDGEWRFGGWLGFGGKLYSNSQGVYVDCYAEQKSPLVAFAIKTANERINALLESSRTVGQEDRRSVRIDNRIERQLVVNSWTVPFIEVVEQMGGKMLFVVDGRLGFEVSAGDFEEVSRLVANAVAVALGIPSHPSRELSEEEQVHYFRNLIHESLRPKLLTEITGVSDAEASS